MLHYSTQSWFFTTEFFSSLHGDIPSFGVSTLKFIHSFNIASTY